MSFGVSKHRSSILFIEKRQRDQEPGGLFIGECVMPGWSRSLSPKPQLGMTSTWCKPNIAGPAPISRQPLQQHSTLSPPPGDRPSRLPLGLSSSFRAADAC